MTPHRERSEAGAHDPNLSDEERAAKRQSVADSYRERAEQEQKAEETKEPTDKTASTGRTSSKG